MLSILSYMRTGDYAGAIIAVLSRCFVVFCCLPIHELAHGLVANRLGDDTARLKGRLTLNPLAHLNPLGTIMIFLVGIGYANPVPVNARNFKNPKAGMALTALAGPVSNILMGWVSIWLYYICVYSFKSSSTFAFAITSFFLYAAEINVMLAVFNLLPIPPLDGSKILAGLLPTKVYFKYMQYERYVMIALFVLLLTGALNGVIGFLTNILINIISFIPNLIFRLL